MSRLPQYVVGSRVDRCISKSRIRTDYGVLQGAADIRTLATKCCYPVTGGEASGVGVCLFENGSLVWQEACPSAEIADCSSACLRNKDLPGFTTVYETSVAARRSILGQRESKAGSGLR